MIDRERFSIFDPVPHWMNEEAIETLGKGYLLPGETPRDLFARVALTVEKYLPEFGLAEDIFDVLYKGYIGLASPVASNFGTNRGLPVSCYALSVDDSISSIYSHLKECAQMSKAGGGVGCVDSETEYLTPYGWKKFKDYEFGDIVAQYDPETDLIEFAEPLDYIKVPEKYLYHFKNKYGIDGIYCSEHRHLTYSQDIDKLSKKVYTTKEILNIHNKNIRGFRSRFKTASQGITNNGLDFTHDELRFICALQADGSLYDHKINNTTISFSFKKKRKINRMRDLLNSLNYRYSESKLDGGCTLFYVWAPEKVLIKYFPKEFYKLSSDQLKIISEEVIHWDGHINGNRHGSYSTIIKSNADFVQFAFTCSGYRSILSTYDRSHEDKSTEYRVHSNKNIYTSISKDIRSITGGEITKVESSDGFKYCFTMPKGTLVLRYNGKISFTRNCYVGNIRPAGSPISGGGTSTGIVPWIKQYDLAASVVSQGNTRRGSFAMYVPIDHPDLPELLLTKDHSQGDPRMFVDSNIAVTITDEWIESMLAGDQHKKELFGEVLKLRMISGSPYIIFIDNVNNQNPQAYKDRGLKVSTSNLCSEITLYTDENHSFVCVLSSLNLLRWEEWKNYRSPNKGMSVPQLGIYLLDAVCEEFIQKGSKTTSMGRSVRFARKSRALGMGTMGLAALYQSKNIPFNSEEARKLNIEIHKYIQSEAQEASRKLAHDYGQPEWCQGTEFRHTHLIACAPTRTNTVISGAISQGIEPMESNLYVAKQAKGTFIRKNPFLEKVLEKYNRNTDETWNQLVSNQGSVKDLDFLTDYEKQVFLTAREIDQFELIRQAGDRQKYICQAQSLNLFVDSECEAEYLFRLHLMAWKLGVKSLYYLRSNSALIKREKTNEIIVITKEDCPYCKKAKEYLFFHGLKFREISRKKADELNLWSDSLGTFPQVYISGTFIGGYDQLMEFYGESERSNECVACEG